MFVAANLLVSEETTVTRQHLVVQENAKYGRHHAGDVDNGHRILKRYQRHGDDCDALGAVSDGVAQRRDQRDDGERDDVLRKVAEAVDQQQRNEPRRVRAVSLPSAHAQPMHMHECKFWALIADTVNTVSQRHSSGQTDGILAAYVIIL